MSRRAIPRQIPGKRGSRFPNARRGFSVYADDMGRQMDIFGIPRPGGSTSVTVPAVAENAKKPMIRIITDSEVTPQLMRTIEIPAMVEIARNRTARNVTDADLTSQQPRIMNEIASQSLSFLDPAGASSSLAANAEPIPSRLEESSLDQARNSVPPYGKESSNQELKRHSPIKCSSLKELLDHIPKNLGVVKKMTISMDLDNGERLVIDGNVAGD